MLPRTGEEIDVITGQGWDERANEMTSSLRRNRPWLTLLRAHGGHDGQDALGIGRLRQMFVEVRSVDPRCR